MFFLFLDAFKLMAHLGGVGTMIIGRLFSLAFFGLGSMLVVSSIVTTYTTVYTSDEIPFLLVRPFKISDIVAYKFLESTGLSSWAFCFIVVPFVGAYAFHENMSPLVGLWTLIFSVPFLFVCGAIGTFIVMITVRWFPIGRKARKVLLLCLAAGACVAMGLLSREVREYSTEVQFSISRFVPGLVLASNPLLPSWWISEGIVSLSRGEWGRGAMLLGMLLSSAMVSFMCIDWVGRCTFYEAWQRVQGSKSTRRSSAVLFSGLDRCLGFLSHDVRALLMKDVRIFFRDPSQWSQALIFFGLLGLYFAHLRSFGYNSMMSGHWLTIIAFVNAFSVSAVMCSIGSRFIYPQLSLEGHGFWVLGLSPISTTKIVLTKFLIAAFSMLGVSILLISISCAMLDVSYSIKLTSVFIVAAVSLAISGLATGLGAVFIDLRQRNPSAIVSGFGGTLNLVLSLGFMLAAIFPFAFVFHLHRILKLGDLHLVRHLWWCSMWLFCVTVAGTVLPLAYGIRSLKVRDF